MRKILAAGLVALLGACGDKGETPLQYGASQAPTSAEQAALANAQATLQAGVASQPQTEPTSGAPGLGDQLVADLGGYTVAAKMPTPASAKAARSAVRQAFGGGGVDPTCVLVEEVAGVTRVTWSGCLVEISEVDPVTGDSMHMEVSLSGNLTSSSATGETTWTIGQTMYMTMTSDGQTLTMNGTASLVGGMTVTASTIAVDSTSNVDVQASYMGIPIDEAVQTRLLADLGYQASPFCITSGTLTVEQRWLRRPMGATPRDLPDQGWRFEWTGCGAFTVAHGS